MSFPSNVENSVKEEMSETSFVLNERNLTVNEEHEFTFVPIQEEKNNTLSETNTDLKSEMCEEIKQGCVLHECLKEKLSFKSDRNNWEGSQQDPLSVNDSDIENVKKEYSCIKDINEEFLTENQEEHDNTDVVEHNVESPVSNDNTIINIYGSSIPGSGSDVKDPAPVKGQKIHKRSYECNECQKMFSTTHNLKTHVQDLHRGIKRYECSECRKTFSQAGNLKIHINTVHKGIRKYECSECNKTATCASYLRQHFESVHKGIKYECVECHKFFTLRKGLKRHIVSVHNGIKKYECNFCNKLFCTKQWLHIHIDSLHKRIRKYECEKCGKKFTTAKYVQTHINNVHRGKKYECTSCGKCFSSSKLLKLHTDYVHKGIKYGCSQCVKLFSRRGNLMTHIRTIHKVIKSNECNYTIKYASKCEEENL